MRICASAVWRASCAAVPDDQVGYSILVYRLTDADVALAIEGPPGELLEKPEWRLEDERLGRTKHSGH